MRNGPTATPPEIIVYPPTPGPRIQRRLEKAGLWPYGRGVEFSAQTRPDQQTLAEFISKNLGKLERSQSSTESRTDYLTAQFSAIIAYALWNHWEELVACDDSHLREFTERIKLIPALESYLKNDLKIAIPTELTFRVFRIILFLKIKISPNS